MGCEMLQIKKFFCCWTLKTGCLIIAYIGLVWNLLQTAGISAQLQYIQNFQNVNTFHQILLYRENTTAYMYYGFRSMCTQWMSVVIAYNAVSILLHAALIWGIHKKRNELILPWLIIKGLQSVFIVCVSIVASIACIINARRMCVETQLLLIAGFILLFWFIYAYMCVYSYYYEIKSTPTTDEEVSPPAYFLPLQDDKKPNIDEYTHNQNPV